MVKCTFVYRSVYTKSGALSSGESTRTTSEACMLPLRGFVRLTWHTESALLARLCTAGMACTAQLADSGVSSIGGMVSVIWHPRQRLLPQCSTETVQTEDRKLSRAVHRGSCEINPIGFHRQPMYSLDNARGLPFQSSFSCLYVLLHRVRPFRPLARALQRPKLQADGRMLLRIVVWK